MPLRAVQDLAVKPCKRCLGFFSDPLYFRRVNGALTIAWIIMIPISIVTGLIDSIPFISAISIYALITGHASTWQSAKVEVNQQAEEEARDDQFEERIERKVDALGD